MSGNLENQLKELRLNASLTQVELAQAVDVSRQTIIALESRRYQPSLELGLRLAKTFDCPVETIFWLSES